MKPLQSQVLSALRTVDGYRLRRVTGGWQCPGSKLVTLAMASKLLRDGLAMHRKYPGTGYRLESTALGKLHLELHEQRRKRA